QIIHATRGPANTPAQCAMVAIANGAHPNVCCVARHPACVTTGALQQIANLITYFGGKPVSYSMPASPMHLYNTLASGKAVILHVRSGQSTSHVVVVRGMSFVPTPY